MKENKMKHFLTAGIHKFILAKDNEGELVVISKDILEVDGESGHEKIFNSEKSLVEVLGGGYLVYHPKSKRILVGNKSYKYGSADHNLVRELLLDDERFADYTIKVV